MRWGVEYECSDGVMIGLILFSAENEHEADKYVDEMCSKYGFTHVGNLKELPDGCSVPELRKHFPGYLRDKLGELGLRKQFRKPLDSSFAMDEL